MNTSYRISDDLVYVGASDRRLAMFENIYPLTRGVSYNSYVLSDEKTALLDTCDSAVRDEFLENLAFALGSKKLDYLIVNHMEPDHCAVIPDILARYPDVEIVTTAKSFQMISQFFNKEVKGITVGEGDTLFLGKHELHFVMAPMVHWPEVMVTYDSTDKVLFSADAFGSFGALSGNMFADEVNFERDWLNEARRYYTNIVGKYGKNVQMLLKKASALDIQMICPLHGPVFRQNLEFILDKYQKWSTYEPEEKAVTIFAASIYGHTTHAAQYLAAELARKGVKNVEMFDVSSVPVSELVAQAFKRSHLVFASPTYNGDIFTPMEILLNDLKAHALQGRTTALIENGTWAPASGRKMQALLEEMKEMKLIAPYVSIKSAVNEETEEKLKELAALIAEDLAK